MGFGKSTSMPGGTGAQTGQSSSKQTGQGAVSAKQSAVLSLQQYLRNTAYEGYEKLSIDGLTGVYDKKTHDAVGRLALALSVADDVATKQAAEILTSLHRLGLGPVQKNPDVVAQVIWEINQASPGRSPGQKQDLSDTPYYEITFPDGVKLLPLALIRSRGYPMYLAILEQYKLLNYDAPLPERIGQLNAALEAIMASLPEAEFPGIRGMIHKADADVRTAWRVNQDRGEAAGDGMLFVTALSDAIPEFRSAPDEIKLSIMRSIGLQYHHAVPFIENPTQVTLQTRIANLPAFQRARVSLLIDTKKMLRANGIRVDGIL